MEQLALSVYEDYKLSENKEYWEFAKRWGYTKPVFNEHGWIKTLLPVVDVIYFPETRRNRELNNIVIGKGPNGLYTYGLHINGSQSGHGSMPTVFDEPFATYEEAKRAALQEFKICIPRVFTEKSDKATAAKFIRFIDAQLALLNPENN